MTLCLTGTSFGQYSDLFISMYAEGSSNNKFIEIYNGTGSDVDLSDYMIKGSNNGNDWKAERDVALTGTLVDGEVYVISTDEADAAILAVADLALEYESPVHYNGDDAIAIFKKNTGGTFDVLDIIGVPTVRPSNGWDVAGTTVATKDHTLTRKNTISGPNTDWASSAGTDETSSEWIVSDKNSGWDSLGSYTPAPATEPCTTDAAQSAAGVAAFDLTMGSALTVLEDGATFEIIDNPDFDNAVNTSCKVGKVTKLGAQNWDNTQIDFDSKFDFSTTNAITIKVWSAQADTEVRIKLEEIDNADNNLEKFQTTSVTGGWEELTFEYASADSDKYNKFVIFFNLNALDSNTYYFDDLKLATVTEPCTTDATQSAAGVAAFDLTMGSALTAIEDGTTFEIIDNPDFDNSVNTSCKVGKVTKLGAENWDNTQIDFDSKFDFSTTNAMTIKVWSAQADTEVRIKLEEIGNPGNNLEKFQTTSVTNGWEELTFEYTSANSDKYNKFVIFFNLNAGDSNTYYFDDLKLVETGGTSDGDYCEKVVAHLGLSDQAASEIKLTVVNSGEKSMKVTIESNNEDAVDFMLIPGDVTGSPTQSAVDESVAGIMSITLTWAETAPTDVALNILWSKVSTEGNWQLGDAPTTFKFDATCATASIDDKLLVSFSMYPNPASSSLNISASSMIKNAVIYNILGKQVMNLSINKNSESINVSNLASGMYLIKYTTESAIGTAKFIKK